MYFPAFQEFEAHSDEATRALPENKPSVIVYDVSSAGDNGQYEIVKKFITKYEPRILVHEGDEFEASPHKWKYGEGTDLYHLVPLVLRHYSVYPYTTSSKWFPNVMQIPLGYIRGMLDYGDPSKEENAVIVKTPTPILLGEPKHEIPTPPKKGLNYVYNFASIVPPGTVGALTTENSSNENGVHQMNMIEAIQFHHKKGAVDRYYLWSFIGIIAGHHGDRHAILDALGEATNTSAGYPFVMDAGLNARQMRDLYAISKFVVVGRGHQNLECYRMYEAIIAGAIPIVVDYFKVVLRTLAFAGDYPPFVIYEPFRSWSKDNFTQIALDIQQMNNSYIDFIREESANWLIRNTQKVHQKVTEMLHQKVYSKG